MLYFLLILAWCILVVLMFYMNNLYDELLEYKDKEYEQNMKEYTTKREEADRFINRLRRKGM